MSILEPDSLSPSEWKVMKVIWRLGACAARDVYQVMMKEYEWTPGTTKTYLRRLVDKKHLTVTQVGNSYLYKPASNALNTLSSAVDELMDNVLEGTAAPLIFQMVKKGKLSEKDIQELRSLLEEYEDNNDGKEIER